MIYQIHFIDKLPADVLAVVHVLREKLGYQWGGNPSDGFFTFYVEYLCCYQNSKVYLGKSDGPFDYPKRTIIFDADLRAQLQLVPPEMWEEYIIGHIQ